QGGEGADAAAVADLAAGDVGVRRRHLRADGRVDHRRVGADDGRAPDASAAAKGGAGLDHRVRGDLDVGVDPGGVGIRDRHPVEHVALVDAPAGDLVDRRQLGAVVDPDVHRDVADLVDDHALAVL